MIYEIEKKKKKNHFNVWVPIIRSKTLSDTSEGLVRVTWLKSIVPFGGIAKDD